jgi:orotate phosphoribosyltransferase
MSSIRAHPTGPEAPRLLLEMLKGELKQGEFTLASGRKSSYYIDARRVTLTSRGASYAAMEIMRRLHGKPVAIHAIGGPATAAVVLVGACLGLAAAWARADLIGFYTRDRPKDHGTGQQIEGPLEPGMSVVLLDDVATSGGSLLKAARAVWDAGCSIYRAFCVLDRLEGATEALAAESIQLESLFTVRDLGVEA